MGDITVRFVTKEDCEGDPICQKVRTAAEKLRTTGVRVSNKWVLRADIPKLYGVLIHDDGFVVDAVFVSCSPEGDCVPRGLLRVYFTQNLGVESVVYKLYYGTLEN